MSSSRTCQTSTLDIRMVPKQRKRMERRLEKSHVNDAYCRGEFHHAKRQNGIVREEEAEEAHP